MAVPPSLPSFSLIFHLRGYSKQIVEFLIARAQLSILIPLVSHSFWDYIHEEEENSLTVSSSISFQINIFRNIYFQIHLFKLAHDFLFPQFLSKSTQNPLHINIANYAKRRERCTFYTYPKQRTILFLSSNSSARPSDRNRSILLPRRNDCSVPLVVKRTCKCYMMLQKKKRKNSENKRAFVYRAKYCGSRVCWVEERGNLDGFVGRSGPLSPHFRRFDFSRAFDVPPTENKSFARPPKSGRDQFDFAEYNILRCDEQRVEKNGISNWRKKYRRLFFPFEKKLFCFSSLRSRHFSYTVATRSFLFKG